MKASETKLQPMIEGTKQYVIPLFQRAYSWGKDEWTVLWNDLKELSELSIAETPRTHFIGSIVTMPTDSVPEGVTKHLLIDGQQRLTTIFILLSFLRDSAKESGDEGLSAEITNTLLVNPYKENYDYYKLLPTQTDRASFQKLIKDSQPKDDDLISQAYIFFRRKFQQSSLDIKTLKKVISNYLSVVSVVLGADDDPHLVFEGLNAKGKPLTQSDLIRNYFFMRIHVDEQDAIYMKYWKPMQDDLQDNLTEYIRHYLTKDGSWVKQRDVYFALKGLVEKDKSLTNEESALYYLKDIAAFAEIYKRIINPAQYETDISIRKALSRLNKVGITTAYPFLLNCYNSYAKDKLSSNELVDVLSTLENFIIRRFICNVPTNKLNKIFPPLYSQIQNRVSGNFVDGLRKLLQSKDYPKDAEFVSKMANSSLYGNKDRTNKATLILQTIEESYKHKESVDLDSLTIEHVMPQKLTDEWKVSLGEDWGKTHELYIHVIGNLTLTGYNSELYNFPFEKKKGILLDSNLELNKYFRDKDSWSEEDIDWRSFELSEKAMEIWSYFGDDQVKSDKKADVTGRTPSKLKVLGQLIPVETWRDVLVHTINTIIELEPEKFDKLTTRFPKAFNEQTSYTPRKLSNGASVEVNSSAKSIYRFCQQILEEVELTSEDWKVRVK